jgi:hypothetical protein
MSASAFTIPFLGSPYPWILLASLFAGAAVSRLTRGTRGKANPERARTRKWIWVCVYLSLAIAFLLLAVFIPGPAKIRDIGLLYVGGAAFVVAFVAVRFKKAIGIPVILLALVAVILLGLFLQSVRAFTGETEIAVVRVISVEAGRMKLELQPAAGMPVQLNMEGRYFAPIVKVVIFDDLYVFLGAKSWYRFVGMTSFDENMRQGNTDYRFPQPAGISENLWAFFENNESWIPGVKTVQVEMDQKRAKEFASYGIRIQNDGGVEIVIRSE